MGLAAKSGLQSNSSSAIGYLGSFASLSLSFLLYKMGINIIRVNACAAGFQAQVRPSTAPRPQFPHLGNAVGRVWLSCLCS